MTSVRVLVADDDAAVLRFTARVFEIGGYVVVTASDGGEAWRLIQEQPPFDVYVLDVRMPVLAGHELARMILRRDPGAKILYFTGDTERLHEARGALSQNEAFLVKPCSVMELLDATSRLLCRPA